VQDFVRSVGAEFRKLYNSQRQTEAELRLFKDEMRIFKDEMSDFKEEMRDFKDEARRQLREMNKKWGELSTKLGTLVEDLVAPSLPRIIEERLNEPTYDLMVRLKRRLPNERVKEFRRPGGHPRLRLSQQHQSDPAYHRRGRLRGRHR